MKYSADADEMNEMHVAVHFWQDSRHDILIKSLVK